MMSLTRAYCAAGPAILVIRTPFLTRLVQHFDKDTYSCRRLWLGQLKRGEERRCPLAISGGEIGRFCGAPLVVTQGQAARISRPSRHPLQGPARVLIGRLVAVAQGIIRKPFNRHVPLFGTTSGHNCTHQTMGT